MSDPRQEHGDHTWDLIVDYFSCPNCHQIVEDRQKYKLIDKQFKKDIQCQNCGNNFTVTSKKKPRFFPLFGDPLNAS